MTWKLQLHKLYKESLMVSDKQILRLIPEEYHSKFEELMRGKTCLILDNGEKGVYSWDLEQIVEKL
jgi:hypothetical protein